MPFLKNSFRALFLLCLATSFLFAAALVLPQPPAQAQGPSWPHSGSGLTPDPAVIFGQLENGVRYAFMQNSEPKDRVTVYLVVQSGSLNETDEQQGLAHYLEHMLFNGTQNFEPGEMVKYFQSIGMRYGPDINAQTGFLATLYHVILPDGNEASLDKALLVMADFASRALLPEEEVERERGVILAEMQARDSVDFRTFKASLEFMLPNARAASRLPIGKEEVIRGADRELLKSYYDAWYRPDKFVVVVVGDFEPELAKPLVTKHFEDKKPRGRILPDAHPGQLGHKGNRFFYHHEKEASGTHVAIEVVYNQPTQVDSIQTRQEALYRSLASAVVQNRLNDIKEQPGAPFTSAGVHASPFLKNIFFASISASSLPENWEATLKVLEQTLRRAIDHGFDASEVDRAKRNAQASLEAAVLAAPTRNSSTLAMQIIGHINDDRVFLSPAQQLELLAPMIEKASPEILHRVFASLWDRDHRLVQVTGNALLEADKPQELIRDVFLQSLAEEVNPLEEQAAPDFPFLPAPKQPGAISSQETFEAIGVERVIFENSLVLNTKKTDFKANEILFSLAFGRGSASQPLNKPGLKELAPAVINDSGLGPLTRQGLARALAGTTASISFSVNQDSFVFSGSAQPKEIELVFQLLQAHLAAPALRQDAFDRAMEQFAQTYLELAQTVDGALRMKGPRFLAGGDPRFGLPEKEEFFALTLEDIRAWVGRAIENEPLELSVVGDIDQQQLVELCALYLGSLPPRQETPPVQAEPVRIPSGKTLLLAVPTVLDKAVVLAAFPTEDIWNIGRTRRLAVLGDVFAERLRERVRESLGITYSPHAWNQPSRAFSGYGSMRAQVVVDASLANAVKDEILNIAGQLAQGGVVEDELARALTPSVTHIRELLRQNRYWLGTVLSLSSRHPEQLYWSTNILDDYQSISVEDVSALAAQYLKPGLAAVVLAVPESAAGAGEETKD